MKINVLKLLCIFLLFASCKNQNTNKTTEDVLPKKKNILENTKWKSSATTSLDVDIILDFYTDKNVQEYIVGKSSEEIKSREGTYKIKGKYLKIKWAGPLAEITEGEVTKKSMELNERFLNLRTYYKISSY